MRAKRFLADVLVAGILTSSTHAIAQGINTYNAASKAGIGESMPKLLSPQETPSGYAAALTKESVRDLIFDDILKYCKDSTVQTLMKMNIVAPLNAGYIPPTEVNAAIRDILGGKLPTDKRYECLGQAIGELSKENTEKLKKDMGISEKEFAQKPAEKPKEVEGPPRPPEWREPGREGVARRPAGEMAFPYGYGRDRVGIEKLDESVKAVLADLDKIDKILNKAGIRTPETTALTQKWRDSLAPYIGKTKEQLEKSRTQVENALNRIPRSEQVENHIRLAKDDAQYFNDVYDGRQTYFHNINQDWLDAFKSISDRITRNNGHMMDGLRQFYSATISHDIKDLDKKKDAVSKLDNWGAQIRQIYAEIGSKDIGVSPEMMTGITYDKTTGKPVLPKISIDPVTHQMSFTDSQGNPIGTLSTFGNREMAMTAITDLENLLNSIFSDPATKGLAQRYFEQFYSDWHVQHVNSQRFVRARYDAKDARLEPGRVEIPAGQEYKYLTENLKTLLFDNEFLKDRRIFVSILGSAEMKVGKGANMAEQKLDNTEVVQKFMGLSLEAQYELIELAKKVGGVQNLNPEMIAKMGILVNTLDGHSPSYTPLLIEKIGKQLFTKFNAEQVMIVSNFLMGYESAFVRTGEYKQLGEWYGSLPSRMNNLFATIESIMATSKEPGEQVQVKLPSEGDFVELYQPAARIVIQIPKHVYFVWANSLMDGMEGGWASVMAAIPPALRMGIAVTPSALMTEQMFFEQGLVYSEVFKPNPFIQIPVLMENLGALAPDQVPNVGPFQHFMGQFAGAYSYEGKMADADSMTGGEIGEQFDMAGIGKSIDQMHQESLMKSGGGQGSLTETNVDFVPFAPWVKTKEELWDVNATYSYMHDTSADAEEIMMNDLSPAGTDTAVYFKHNEDEAGVDRYRAYIYKRFQNGIFGYVGYEDLEPAQAQSLYNNIFKEADQSSVVRKMYSKAGVRGTGDEKKDKDLALGDWRFALEGCVLFAGNDGEFMVKQPNASMFQGAGGSIEKYNAGGAGGFYENTRNGRAVVGGGSVDAKQRMFAIGKIYGKNLEREGEPATYGGGGLAEDQSVQFEDIKPRPMDIGVARMESEVYDSGKRDMELEMWCLKDERFNAQAYMNTLGMAEGASKYGGLYNFMADGSYFGGGMKGNQEKGEWGNSSYAVWGKEMGNALVASGLMQTVGEKENIKPADLAAGMVLALRRDISLEGIAAYHLDTNGDPITSSTSAMPMLTIGGAEPETAAQMRKRAEGATQAGALLKFVIDPVSGVTELERIEIQGAYYQKEPGPGSEEKTMRTGVGGIAFEGEKPLPWTLEAVYPGAGELKLTIGPLDVVAGGGRTMFEGAGGHAGLRYRAGRSTFFLVGSGEYKAQPEAAAGQLATGGVTTESPGVANVFDSMLGWRYLLSQNIYDWRLDLVTAVSGTGQKYEGDSTMPWQADLQAALVATEALQQLSASVGASYWNYGDEWRARWLISLSYTNMGEFLGIYDCSIGVATAHDWAGSAESGKYVESGSGTFQLMLSGSFY